jgi:hypothetical protein
MTICHNAPICTITAAFLPKDSFPRRYRYWPSPRQLPSLERRRFN